MVHPKITPPPKKKKTKTKKHHPKPTLSFTKKRKKPTKKSKQNKTKKSPKGYIANLAINKLEQRLLKNRYYLPLNSRMDFKLTKILNPLHPRMLCANSIETDPVVLEKIFKYRQSIFISSL